jgi:hypothetical protein
VGERSERLFLASGGDDPDEILPLRALVRIGVVGYPAMRVDHRFKDGDTIRLGRSRSPRTSPAATRADAPHGRSRFVTVIEC